MCFEVHVVMHVVTIEFCLNHTDSGLQDVAPRDVLGLVGYLVIWVWPGGHPDWLVL
jgi:hypothetical protein